MEKEYDRDSTVDAGCVAASAVALKIKRLILSHWYIINRVVHSRLINPPINSSVFTNPLIPINACTLRPRMSSMKLPKMATTKDQQLIMTWT